MLIVPPLPRTLEEAVEYFSNPRRCLGYLISCRWPDRVAICPVCGSSETRYLANRSIWECKRKHASSQFSVRVGTFLEDSRIGLDQWLVAIWVIANSPRRVSSYALSRQLAVTQKSAWFILHRIRCALQASAARRAVQES